MTRRGFNQGWRGNGRWFANHRSLLLGFTALGLIASVAPVQAIVEKPFIKPITSEPAAGTVADFSAEKLTFDPATKLAVATGRVVVTYGPYTLNATRVTFNERTNVFTANGSVELREPNGNVMLAETLELTNKFKQGFARHLKALLTNDVTITARLCQAHGRQHHGIRRCPLHSLQELRNTTRAIPCGNWFQTKPRTTKTPKTSSTSIRV